MVYLKYILTTYRLLVNKWWLSLIKLCSLTMGMISFMLVWLFYMDHQIIIGNKISFVDTCTTENVLILGVIILITVFIYFLLMKSQITFRHKEFFLRKLYGESIFGIFYILLIETTIFILGAFILSLVLIDQVAPFFNLITDKSIDTRQLNADYGIIILLCFFVLIGFAIGLVPAINCAGKRAVDLLKKLPE